jgi:pimeloyl-ACP methyl ester carboxylesterase
MRLRIELLLFAFPLPLSAAHGPAFAQASETDIPASWIAPHAGYYAPYALHSVGAYLPVSGLDKTRSAEPGADAEYVVQNTFKDKDFGAQAAEIRERARAALDGWHYKFGSEAYLSCVDRADADCLKKLPGRLVAKPGSGPAFHVWALDSSFPDNFLYPESCAEVAITFRGTVMSRKSDWAANAHYLSKYVVDNHYRQLSRNIDGIIKRVAALDCYKQGDSARIVSSGHSLGGGLAQLAALANKRGPKISKVFAFDPSPVTGADLVDKKTLADNSAGLEIDRIFQSGEILENFRNYAQQYPPTRKPCDPLVRAVAVDVLRGGPVVRHGMAGMAAELVQLSNAGIRTTRPIARNCVTRYERQMTPKNPVMPLAAAFPDLDAEPIVPATKRRGPAKARLVNASVSFGPAKPESDDPFQGVFSP